MSDNGLKISKLIGIAADHGGYELKEYLYSETVTAARLAVDYTARVIPQGKGVAVPLESAQILWQR